MVEVSEIVDEASLREWLEALPFHEPENQRTAVAFACRAAMRTLPVYWLWSNGDSHPNRTDGTALAVLRCVLIAMVLGAQTRSGISEFAIEKASKSGYAAARAAGADDATSAAAAYAAAAAAGAKHVHFSSIIEVIDAVSDAARVSDSIWKEIRRDCNALGKSGFDLFDNPLWEAENPLSDPWFKIRKSLPAGYEFWRDWYQDALDGAKPNWDMLTEIALIDPKDWDKGAEHVNGLIAQKVEKYRLLEQVRKYRAELAKEKRQAGTTDMRGHNNPPERVESEAKQLAQVEIIWASLGDAEEELKKPSPSPGKLKQAGQVIVKATKYLLELADIATKEAAKSLGKYVAPPLAIYVLSKVPAIQNLAEHLIQFAKVLF